MSNRNDAGCLWWGLEIVLALVGGIIGLASIVALACASVGAFVGMFIHDEGFFTLFGNIFVYIFSHFLYLHKLDISLSEVLDVLKWVPTGVIGLCVALPLLSFMAGILAGLFWVYWAALLANGVNQIEPRVVRGVRMGYFHWTGNWFREWWNTCGEAADLCFGWRWRETEGAAAVFAWSFGLGALVGGAVIALIHFSGLLVFVALAWVFRVAVAAWLRDWMRALREVRECRHCQAWTVAPAWRCPRCGQLHWQLEPSAKFGVLWWHCGCGARLPTLGVLGRQHLEEECPECGGELEGVGRAPAGVTFLGGTGAEISRLARNLDASRDGGRQLRVYEVPERIFQTAEYSGQHHWAHVGVVVFSVDTSDIHSAAQIWERWRIFMDRECPRRSRSMACAVVLGASAGTALSSNAGDADCRAYLDSLETGGNLLNALDGAFLRVCLFPAGAEAAVRAWVVREAFRVPLPAVARPRSMGWGVLWGIVLLVAAFAAALAFALERSTS